MIDGIVQFDNGARFASTRLLFSHAVALLIVPFALPFCARLQRCVGSVIRSPLPQDPAFADRRLNRTLRIRLRCVLFSFARLRVRVCAERVCVLAHLPGLPDLAGRASVCVPCAFCAV